MKDSHDAHLFCLDVSHWPMWLLLLICSVGIFSSFLLHGIAHEHLIKTFHLTETFFLTFIQFVGYSFLSLPTLIKMIFHYLQKNNLQRKFNNRVSSNVNDIDDELGNINSPKKYKTNSIANTNINCITENDEIEGGLLKAPLYLYFITSLALAFSMGLTNFATARLSYATGVLFKSSKLIPVMIGNIIFLKKKPKLSETVSVVLIVLGLIGVSLGDFRGKNKFDVPGIIAISLSLVAGGVASNMEDKVMSHYNASQGELISVLYSMGAIIMLTLSVITGQFTNGVQKIQSDKKSIIFLMLFGLLGSIGIQFVYLTMKIFGSLVTVMITSLRKALTVVLSFILFKDKKFTILHAFAILLISLGMALNVFEKTKKKANSKFDEEEKNLLNKDEIGVDVNYVNELDDSSDEIEVINNDRKEDDEEKKRKKKEINKKKDETDLNGCEMKGDTDYSPVNFEEVAISSSSKL